VTDNQSKAKHYTLLRKRLMEEGSYYGEFDAHDGLWESASRTASSLLARLSIEHMVHGTNKQNHLSLI